MITCHDATVKAFGVAVRVFGGNGTAE